MTKGLHIDKLAKKIAKKKAKQDRGKKYLQGSGKDKVWINFQVTKDFKREFAELCKDSDVNASAYLKACCRILINNKGNIFESLKEVKKVN